jgi:hypothetical protein
MSDDLQSSLRWIEDTRKKFAYFNSPVVYLTQSLNLLEKSYKETASLKEAFIGLRDDLIKSPETVSYQRDELITWINDILSSSKNSGSK